MFISARGLLGAKVSVEINTRSGKILRPIYTVNNICDRRAKLTRCNELRRGFKSIRKLRLDLGEVKYRIEGYSANAAKADLTVRLAPPVTQNRRSRRTPSPRFYPLSNYSVLDLPEGVNGSDIDFSSDFSFIRSGATGPSEVLSTAAKFALNLPIDADVSLKNGATFDAQFCASCHSGLNPDPKLGKNLSEILYSLKFNPAMAGVLDSINAQAGSQNAASLFLYEITAHNNRHKIEVIPVAQDPGSENPENGGSTDPSSDVVRNPDGSINYISNAVYSDGTLTSGAKEALGIPSSFSVNMLSGEALDNKYCASCHPNGIGGVRRLLPYDQVSQYVQSGQMVGISDEIARTEGFYEQSLAAIVAYLWRSKLNPVVVSNPVTTPSPSPSPGSGGSGSDDPIVETQYDMSAYQGAFGFDEAKVLCDRFLFACSNGDIENLVNLGLEGAINEITRALDYTPNGADYSDVLSYRNILCYGEYDNAGNTYNNYNSAQKLCLNDHPYGTDVSILNAAMLNAFMKADSHALRFRLRHMYFLHDERMSVDLGVGRFRERRYADQRNINHPLAVFKHHEMLWNSSLNMNYKDYLQGTIFDHVLHGSYLSGYANSSNEPNENFARELWELGSTGTNWHANHSNADLRGKEVYSQVDVAQANKCLIGLVPGSVLGPKHDNASSFEQSVNPLFDSSKIVSGETLTVFIGSPYQRQLTTGNANNPCWSQLLSATLDNPATAENIAFDMIKEYLVPEPTYSTVAQVAQIIRENNFNLLPAYRFIMRSKALYDGSTRSHLISHPIELYAKLFRIFPSMPLALVNSNLDSNTGLPTGVDDVPNEIARRMVFKMGVGDHISQILFNAPSVFGYYPEQMFSAGGQLAHRRYIQDVMKGFRSSTRTQYNQWELIGNNNGSIPQFNFSSLDESRQAVRFYAEQMRILLNDSQVEHLALAMNASHPDIPNIVVKRSWQSTNPGIDVSNLVTILARLPEFMVK